VSRRRAKGPTPQRRWQPLQPGVIHAEKYTAHGMTAPDRSYYNDLLSVFVREIGHGALHISFHRHDRKAIKDFRIYQAIKNEVAGPERLAIEVFPPESKLVDTSNEFHLFVVPEEIQDEFPFLISAERLVQTQEEGEAILGKTKMRQRPWQPGIPTGKGLEEK
jgi:hypothetical protein